MSIKDAIYKYIAYPCKYMHKDFGRIEIFCDGGFPKFFCFPRFRFLNTAIGSLDFTIVFLGREWYFRWWKSMKDKTKWKNTLRGD